ncbi:reverse transcriptase domain-containing protein [Tanacetum coccineum]
MFAWQPSDMTGVPRSVAKHRLNIREGYSPVRQKKRGQAPDRVKAIQAEVQKLVGAGIMREVYYHDWLSNPVMVKKHDDSWRMCMDFTDLNKACPQDCYPFPEIDWKVESLCGYPFKCFLDAYKGYHQIQMAESDEEKITFHTNQGAYCYTKIPLALKTSELLEGMFLGYTITPEGIKPCLGKTEAVLQFPSPQTIKEVQSLNGKLASLNRFLSKLAEKSLPLFKTLKKCIKKSDFHWTSEAEQAFKQLKQHLSELPLLVAPKPKEELIVYLSASYGAVSEVLMTERGTVEMSVYFISRALQGPELNYTPMEKLILSLVFAAKRLQRYFQAHPIAVITDQPIKQIISRPDVAGRLQKWSVMLGEHNIIYRPRTSVKGQILADFLVEKPGENPPDTSVVKTLPKPWILFTDGSSCVDGSVAEYEVLIASLQIAAQMGVRNVKIEAKAVATITRNQVKKFVWDNIVCHFGLPGEIVSDNGKQFSDNPFKDWCDKLNITQRFASVKYPQSNGLVERANRSLGEGIKERLGEGNKNWVEELPHVLWAHRAMIKSSHRDTPFSLTYGTEAVIPAEIKMPTYRTVTVDAVHNDEELQLNLDLLEEKRERLAICEAKAKRKMTKYYNARVRGVTFRPGDFVYRSNDASHAMAGEKLGPK